MINSKRIAQNTIILYFRMVFVMLISLYTSRIILAALGIDDYGIYNVVGGVIVMFTFINDALGGATSRFLTLELGREDYIKLKQTFSTTLTIHIFIAIIILLFAETVGLWLLTQKMVIPPERMHAAHYVYQFSIIGTLFSITQVPYNAAIIAHERMNIYAYVAVIEVILKLLIAFLIKGASAEIDRLILYSLLMLVVSAIIMIIYRIYCIKHYKECHFSVQKDKALYKQILSYTSYDLIGNISGVAQGQGMNILLNIFFGPGVNAARGIAYQIQGAVTKFSSSFMTAIRPQLIKQYALGNTENVLNLLYNSSKYSYFLMLIFTIPICIEIEFILKIWLGNFPDHTITFAILVLILCLFQSIKGPRVTVFHATGNIKLLNMTVGTLLCLSLPISYFFLKKGATPESVFIVMIAVFLISEVISIIILKKYIDYNIKEYVVKVYGNCVLVTLVSLPIPLLIYYSLSPGFYRFLCVCFSSLVMMCFSVYFIGTDKNTKKKIKSTVLNVIKKYR
ncbi:lipopolysaccharide biosynthesis protein [Bacteroides sp. 224]|uniref:lipopolysaccharide biosynthesis protein n=1 Tax=Bacteroides sp. 224 TaxID=2302936 RepID=UPI0013CFB317|nr:oligosaccharide flippase family protein [Bacteroides sp. 224]NDV65188.1 multidrug transporter [Bacteroides sp. 224]